MPCSLQISVTGIPDSPSLGISMIWLSRHLLFLMLGSFVHSCVYCLLVLFLGSLTLSIDSTPHFSFIRFIIRPHTKLFVKDCHAGNHSVLSIPEPAHIDLGPSGTAVVAPHLATPGKLIKRFTIRICVSFSEMPFSGERMHFPK